MTGVVCVFIVHYLFTDGDAIKALDSRQGDRQARDFIKKQRQKMPSKQFFSLG